jgi:hypothetical protein
MKKGSKIGLGIVGIVGGGIGIFYLVEYFRYLYYRDKQEEIGNLPDWEKKILANYAKLDFIFSGMNLAKQVRPTK